MARYYVAVSDHSTSSSPGSGWLISLSEQTFQSNHVLFEAKEMHDLHRLHDLFVSEKTRLHHNHISFALVASDEDEPLSDTYAHLCEHGLYLVDPHPVNLRTLYDRKHRGAKVEWHSPDGCGFQILINTNEQVQRVAVSISAKHVIASMKDYYSDDDDDDEEEEEDDKSSLTVKLISAGVDGEDDSDDDDDDDDDGDPGPAFIIETLLSGMCNEEYCTQLKLIGAKSRRSKKEKSARKKKKAAQKSGDKKAAAKYKKKEQKHRAARKKKNANKDPKKPKKPKKEKKPKKKKPKDPKKPKKEKKPKDPKEKKEKKPKKEKKEKNSSESGGGGGGGGGGISKPELGGGGGGGGGNEGGGGGGGEKKEDHQPNRQEPQPQPGGGGGGMGGGGGGQNNPNIIDGNMGTPPVIVQQPPSVIPVVVPVPVPANGMSPGPMPPPPYPYPTGIPPDPSAAPPQQQAPIVVSVTNTTTPATASAPPATASSSNRLGPVDNDFSSFTKPIQHKLYAEETDPQKLPPSSVIAAERDQFYQQALRVTQKFAKSLMPEMPDWSAEDQAKFKEMFERLLPLTVTNERTLPDVNELLDITELLAEEFVSQRVKSMISRERLARKIEVTKLKSQFQLEKLRQEKEIQDQEHERVRVTQTHQEGASAIEQATSRISAFANQVRGHTQSHRFLNVHLSDGKLMDQYQFYNAYVDPQMQALQRELRDHGIPITTEIASAAQDLSKALLEHYAAAVSYLEMLETHPAASETPSTAQVQSITGVLDFFKGRKPSPTIDDPLVKRLYEFYNYSVCSGEGFQQELRKHGFRPSATPEKPEMQLAYKHVAQLADQVLQQKLKQQQKKKNSPDVSICKRDKVKQLSPDTPITIHMKLLQPMLDQAIELEELYVQLGGRQHLDRAFDKLVQAGISPEEVYRFLHAVFVSKI